MVNILDPLSTQVPIVDEKGCPTPQFQRLLQKLQAGTGLTVDPVTGVITISQVTLDLLEPIADQRVLGNDSGGAATPTEVSASQVLDWIGTGHGAILYRDSTGWAVLPPDDDGKVLTTHDTGADPTWETPSGGGSSYERTRVIPEVADFTLENAGTASITDKTYGMLIAGPNVGTQIRFVRDNTAPPSTPYSIITRCDPVRPGQGGGYFNCIILRNSSNGRLIISGIYSGANFLVQNWSGYAAYNSDVLGVTSFPFLSNTSWQKLENDGTNLTWFLSPDGDAWYQVATTTLAAYLTASGGTLDQIGFGVLVNGTDVYSIQQSYEVV